MSDLLPFSSQDSTTHCRRCGEKCRRGTPDASKQAIVQAREGYCPACVIEKFLRSVEPIRAMIDGDRGREPLGPEIFLNETWRTQVLGPVLAGVLVHTQLPPDSINWMHVVANWGVAFPA